MGCISQFKVELERVAISCVVLVAISSFEGTGEPRWPHGSSTVRVLAGDIVFGKTLDSHSVSLKP